MRLTSEDLAGLVRPPAPPVAHEPPRLRSMRQRLSVLALLAEFSHLRTVEISAGCFPKARSGLQLAQRCLKRLTEANEVHAVRNSVGTTSYVLTHVGARTLLLHGMRGKHGLNLRSYAGGSFLHHAITSRYAIEQRNLGNECYTEYGIAAGFAPFSTALLRSRFKKSCDGMLIRHASGGSGRAPKTVIAVEVEAARKPGSEVARILSIADKVGQWLDEDHQYVIGGVAFAFNASQGHAAYIRKVAQELWQQRPSAERQKLASAITLVKMRYALPLTFQGFSEETLAL
jgi:hypothetical protein